MSSVAHRTVPMWTVPLVLVRRTASPAYADFSGIRSLAALVVVRLVVVPLILRFKDGKLNLYNKYEGMNNQHSGKEPVYLLFNEVRMHYDMLLLWGEGDSLEGDISSGVNRAANAQDQPRPRRRWQVVCWADILLDVISGVESTLREGCPRTMTGVSQYWFSGHFRQVFSTPMHYPALALEQTCGANRAS